MFTHRNRAIDKATRCCYCYIIFTDKFEYYRRFGVVLCKYYHPYNCKCHFFKKHNKIINENIEYEGTKSRTLGDPSENIYSLAYS